MSAQVRALKAEAKEEQAYGHYHVADCLFLAAEAVRRGDSVSACIWQEAAREERSVLELSVA